MQSDVQRIPALDSVKIREFCPFSAISVQQVGLQRTDCLGNGACPSALFLRSRDQQSDLRPTPKRTSGDHKSNPLKPRRNKPLNCHQCCEASRERDKAVEAYQSLFTMFPDAVEYSVRLVNAEISEGKTGEAQATV